VDSTVGANLCRFSSCNHNLRAVRKLPKLPPAGSTPAASTTKFFQIKDLVFRFLGFHYSSKPRGEAAVIVQFKVWPTLLQLISVRRPGCPRSRAQAA
jgi:hypothetical protein